MAPLREPPEDVFADAVFHVDPASSGLHGRPRGLGRTEVLEARGVARFLHVHAEIDHVAEDLRVSLRLHGAAHQAEGEPGPAVLRHHGRYDGMEGPLVGGEGVAVRGIQREELAPVLDRKPRALRHDARSESPEDALDERHGVAVLVDDGHVGRIPVLQDGIAGRDVHGRPAGIDAPALPRGVVLRQQGFHGHVREGGIGIEHGAVGIGQFLGFDLQMQRFRRLAARFGEVVAFQDVQHLQGGDALPARRQFPDRMAPIVHANRIVPGRHVVPEVLGAEQSADIPRTGHYGFGDFAVVERVAAAFGQDAVGSGQVRIPERRAGLGGLPAGQIDPHGLGPGLQQRRGSRPVPRNDVRNGKPVLRVGDGGLQHLFHGQGAEAIEEAGPAVDAAWHGPVERPGIGYVVVPQPGIVFDRRRVGRPAAGVEAGQLAALRLPDDGEQVPADAAGHGFHHAEGRVDGDGGVDGVAARLEDVDARLGGQGLARGHHAAGRHDDRAPRASVCVGVVSHGLCFAPFR